MSTFTVNNLSVERGGKRVIDDLSFTMQSGRITALLGPNGAGKSSLVLAIAGALPIASGTVAIDGRVVSGQSPEVVRAAGIAAVPEGHRVLSSLNVEDNLQAA